MERVPRTRPELARDAKVREILDAAGAIVAADGMGALSIAGVARAVGITANAVHWYFPRREDLGVAVLERMGEQVFARKPPAAGWRRQLLWLVDRFADVYPHAVALRESAPSSETIRSFEDELYASFRLMLTHALGPHVRAGEGPDDAATLFLAAVLGCYQQRLSRSRRRRVLDRLLDAVVTDVS